MVKIKAKYRKRTTHFGRALVKVRSETEKNTHFGRAFVRVRAKIMKNTLVARLWLKQRKSSFLCEALVRIRS